MSLTTRFRVPLLIAVLACTLTPSPAHSAVVPTTLVTGLKQVNHLLVDDISVYWTEVTTNQTLLRTMPKAGGPIVDLAAEPLLHQGQFASYVHLQQIGDRLYWSRLSSGFVTRWSLRSIDKAGGPVQEVLPEQIAVNPLLPGAWRVAGDELLVALQDPDELGLPDDTRIAAYHPETDAWRAILSSNLRRGAAFIIAADAANAWVRGLTSNDETEIGHVSLDTPEPVYTELLHIDDEDREVDEPGAADAAHLFFWSRTFNAGLRRLPLAGGNDSQVVKGSGTGLVVTEGFLYWGSGKKILKRAVAGTSTIKHFNGAFQTATVGGLAHDADFLYLLQKKSGRFNIIRIDK